MAFTHIGGNTWGTDEISPTASGGTDMSDIFMTQPMIEKHQRWPPADRKYPTPNMKKKKIKSPNRVDGFDNDTRHTLPQMTDNMLMIVLLVILVVICTMIYSTVRQTCEHMKLISSILASR